MRRDFKVTTKVALYSDDGQHIVVMFYSDQNGYGLPGGHVDEGEVPDQAMARELQEEIGLSGLNLIHKDFFMHEQGKLVLGYTGIIPADTELSQVDLDGLGRARWITKDELEKISIEPNYRRFALANWPK